jgi:hypothetical protein
MIILTYNMLYRLKFRQYQLEERTTLENEISGLFDKETFSHRPKDDMVELDNYLATLFDGPVEQDFDLYVEACERLESEEEECATTILSLNGEHHGSRQQQQQQQQDDTDLVKQQIVNILEQLDHQTSLAVLDNVSSTITRQGKKNINGVRRKELGTFDHFECDLKHPSSTRKQMFDHFECDLKHPSSSGKQMFELESEGGKESMCVR